MQDNLHFKLKNLPTLLSAIVNETSDIMKTIKDFEGYLHLFHSNEIALESIQYFHNEFIPSFIDSLLKRRFTDNTNHINAVKQLLLNVLDYIIPRLSLSPTYDGLFLTLTYIFNPQCNFYVKYSQSKDPKNIINIIPETVAQLENEKLANSLQEGNYIDYLSSDSKWECGMIVQIGPYRTQIEVINVNTEIKQWINVDNSKIAVFGTKFGSNSEEVATMKIDDDEHKDIIQDDNIDPSLQIDNVEWKDSLCVGDLVDAMDSYNTWYQAVILEVYQMKSLKRVREEEDDIVAIEIDPSGIDIQMSDSFKTNEEGLEKFLRIAYIGFPESKDEWIECNSPRIDKLDHRSKSKRGVLPIREEVKYLTKRVLSNEEASDITLRISCFVSLYFFELVSHLSKYGCLEIFVKLLQLETSLSQCLYLMILFGHFSEILSNHFINSYGEHIISITSQKLLDMNQLEIRHLSGELIETTFSAMQSLLHVMYGRTEKSGKMLETVWLQIAIIQVSCPFLNRRLGGLKLLIELLRRARLTVEFPNGIKRTELLISGPSNCKSPSNGSTTDNSISSHLSLPNVSYQVISVLYYLNSESISQEILRCKVISSFFEGEQAHASLIERSNEILKMLALENLLSIDLVDVIWRSAIVTKESASVKVLLDIISVANYELLIHLRDYFQSIDTSKVSIDAINILEALSIRSRTILFKDETSNGVNRNISLKVDLDSSILILFWKFFESNHLHKEIIQFVHHKLTPLISVAIPLNEVILKPFPWSLHWLRCVQLVDLAVTHLPDYNYTYLSLAVLSAYITSWPIASTSFCQLNSNIPIDNAIRSNVILFLESSLNLTSTILQTLKTIKSSYNTIVNEEAIDSKQVNFNNSPVSYQTTITKIIDFLGENYRASDSQQKISQEVIGLMWDTLVKQAVASFEVDVVLKFISKFTIPKFKGTSYLSSSMRFTDKTLEYIFLELLCQRDFLRSIYFDDEACSCVERVFLLLNVSHECIRLIDKDKWTTSGFHIISSLKTLPHWKMLVDITIYSYSASVAKKMSSFITSFPQKIISDLPNESVSIASQELVETTMNILKELHVNQKNQKTTSSICELNIPIQRALFLLNDILDEAAFDSRKFIRPHGFLSMNSRMITFKISFGSHTKTTITISSLMAIQDLIDMILNEIQRKRNQVSMFFRAKDVYSYDRKALLCRLSPSLNEVESIIITEKQKPVMQSDATIINVTSEEVGPFSSPTCIEIHEVLDNNVDNVVSNTLPAVIMSQSHTYMQVLFDLIESSDYDIAFHAWNILNRLPTSPRSLQDILQQSDDRLANVLISNSIPRLFYHMMIIENILSPNNSNINTTPEYLSWPRKFLENDGINSLFSIFFYVSNSLETTSSSPSLIFAILKLLTRLLRATIVKVDGFTESMSTSISKMLNKSNTSTSTSTSSLISGDLIFNCHIEDGLSLKIKEQVMENFQVSAIKILAYLQRLSSLDESDGYSKFYGEYLENLYVIWSILIHLIPSSIIFFVDHFKVIRSLLISSSKMSISTNEDLCISMWLCNTIMDFLSYSNDYDSSSVYVQMLNLLVTSQPIVDELLESSLNYGQYFELLNKLLVKSLSLQALLTDDFVLTTIQRAIHNLTDIVEKKEIPGLLKFNGTQQLLQYSFITMTHLSSNNSMICQYIINQHIPLMVLRDFLGLHMNETLVLCLSSSSKQAAYDLLLSLCTNNSDIIQLLFHEMRPIHEFIPKPNSFSFDIQTEQICYGYVGLKNLGSTCYMNSLLQLLFSIANVRDFILHFSTIKQMNSEEVRDDYITQLKKVFSYLQFSQIKSFSPNDWFFCYKDDSNKHPIDVSQQQDAQEFLQVLFDRLEFNMKSHNVINNQQVNISNKSNSFDNIIGGVLCNQMIKESSLEMITNSCHLEELNFRERHESFICLSLDVKGCHSLENSLDKFIQGERIEDFHWNEHESKTTIIKRQLIHRLSDTLIFHLKRFELNFDTFQREKLNDYFPFPLSLNMFPYTRESMMKDKSLHPMEYYQFELYGVVVHTGTADSGHYYSFLKVPQSRDRDRYSNSNSNRLLFNWLEFNDSVIKPFDIKKLGSECYGGTSSINEYNEFTKTFSSFEVPNAKSAYMLLYRRTSSLNSTTTTMSTSILPSDHPLVSNIIRENKQHELSLRVMSTSHIEFLTNIHMKLVESKEQWSHSIFDIHSILCHSLRIGLLVLARLSKDFPIKQYFESYLSLLESLDGKELEIPQLVSCLINNFDELVIQPLFNSESEIRLLIAKLIFKIFQLAFTFDNFGKDWKLEDIVLTDRISSAYELATSYNSQVLGNATNSMNTNSNSSIDVENIVNMELDEDEELAKAILLSQQELDTPIEAIVVVNTLSEKHKVTNTTTNTTTTNLSLQLLIQMTSSNVLKYISEHWRRSDGVLLLLSYLSKNVIKGGCTMEMNMELIRRVMLQREVIASMIDIFLCEHSPLADVLYEKKNKKLAVSSFISVFPTSNTSNQSKVIDEYLGLTLCSNAMNIPNWTLLLEIISQLLQSIDSMNSHISEDKQWKLVSNRRKHNLNDVTSISATYLQSNHIVSLSPITSIISSWDRNCLTSKVFYSTMIRQSRYMFPFIDIMRFILTNPSTYHPLSISNMNELFSNVFYEEISMSLSEECLCHVFTIMEAFLSISDTYQLERISLLFHLEVFDIMKSNSRNMGMIISILYSFFEVTSLQVSKLQFISTLIYSIVKLIEKNTTLKYQIGLMKSKLRNFGKLILKYCYQFTSYTMKDIITHQTFHLSMNASSSSTTSSSQVELKTFLVMYDSDEYELTWNDRAERTTQLVNLLITSYNEDVNEYITDETFAELNIASQSGDNLIANTSNSYGLTSDNHLYDAMTDEDFEKTFK